jgi:hypothetical protein
MLRILATAVLATTLAATASAQLNDPMGDAQDTFGAGPPLLDIDTMSVTYDATTLYLAVTFFTPISPASAMAPDSVIGFFELDTDQNVATGLPPVQNQFSPVFATLAAGIDYAILLATEAAQPGMVDVFDSAMMQVATVPIAFGPTSFSFQIPLAALGGDDGIVDFTTTLGTFAQPTDATDVVGTSEAVAECFLVIGDEPGDSDFVGSNHVFDTLVGGIASSYPVSLTGIPEFVIPIPMQRGSASSGGLSGTVGAAVDLSECPEFMQDGQFAIQLLMWNPVVFPGMPEQTSGGLSVEILPNGKLQVRPYGSAVGGVTVWHEIEWTGERQLVVRFPFAIAGL